MWLVSWTPLGFTSVIVCVCFFINMVNHLWQLNFHVRQLLHDRCKLKHQINTPQPIQWCLCHCSPIKAHTYFSLCCFWSIPTHWCLGRGVGAASSDTNRCVWAKRAFCWPLKATECNFLERDSWLLSLGWKLNTSVFEPSVEGHSKHIVGSLSPG